MSSQQAIKEKHSFIDSFYSLQERQRGKSPSWLKELRESALNRFEELGFPDTNEEDWKYTSVALIAKGEFDIPIDRARSSVDAQVVKQFGYPETEHCRLVFVNGFYRADLSSLDALPSGVVAADFNELFTSEYAELLRNQLSRTRTGDHENAFTALNTAFFNGGAFVYIPKGVQVDAPIHLLFLSEASGAQTASFPRVLIVAERESQATIIESYAGIGDSSYLMDAMVDVHVEDNARLTHYKVQQESDQAFHIATTRADLHRNSIYDATTITLGAQLSRHNIGLDLHKDGIECWVDGLAIVGTGQHTDTHSLINHRSPHCTSHQLYKNILDGKSRVVFNGRIYVYQAAQKTDAYQTSRSLLLSKEARVDTKPQLEIFADDVKCSHGATIGQLNEEELFYLISRGLRPDRARNLLTYGFAEEVVEKIKVESIKTQLDQIILNRLHADFDIQG